MKKVLYSMLIVLLTSSMFYAQGKFGLGVYGGLVSPTGDMGDLYKAGFGANASLSYNISESFQLTLSPGYYHFSFNSDFFNDELKAQGIDQTVDVDAPLTIIPVMAGAKYFFANGKFKPYVSAEVGLHFVTLTAKSVTIGGVKQDVGQDTTDTKSGWGVGVGFQYEVSPKVSIEVAGKFNGTAVEFGHEKSATVGSTYSYSESSKSTGTFFSVMAGVHFAF